MNIKKHILYFFSSLTAVFILASSSPVLAAGESPISGKYLGVFQTTGLPESGYAPGFLGRLGTVRFDEDRGLNLQSQGSEIPTDGRVNTVPYINYDPSNPLPQSEFLRLAGFYQQGAINTLVEQMKTFMLDNGATDGSFTYRQRITVQNNPVPKVLTWRLLIDSVGKPRFSAPKITSDVPTFTHVKYWPKRLEEGLPDSWAYPNQGAYTYQLVDQNMNPIGGIEVVDTNGAFDEPVPAPGLSAQPMGCEIAPGDVEASCDPDYLVSCFADKTFDAECPTAYPDASDLMDLLGSDGVIFDYHRKIQPVYEGACASGAAYNADEGECADGTDPVEVAQLFIDVRRRELIKSSCLPGAKYINEMDYGYKLKYLVDRFNYNYADGLLKTGSEQSEGLSPNQSIALELKLSTIPANIADLVINPIEMPRELTHIDEFDNVLNLAAVQSSFTGSPVYYYDDAYPSNLVNGGQGVNYQRIKVECVGGLIRVYYGSRQGGVPESYRDPGQSPPAQFTVGTPSNASTGWYARIKRVSMDLSTTFCYDGNERITLCGSPQWDGNPGRDHQIANSPPPRGVSWCPSGSVAKHIFSAGGQQSNGFYGGGFSQQTSELYCAAPPAGYGNCPRTITATSNTSMGCFFCGGTRTYYLQSQGATTCTYGGYGTTARPPNCPAGASAYGSECNYGTPQFYIKLE